MLDNKIKKSKKKLLTLGAVSLGGIILLTAATTMLVPQSLSQNLSTVANFNEYYSVSRSEIATLKALISQNNTLTNPQKEALETNIDKILNGSNHSDNPNTNITSPLSIDVDKSLEYNTKYEYKLNYNKQLSNQVNLWPLLNKKVVKDLIKNVYYNRKQLDINDFRLALINQLNDDENNLKEILKQDTNNLYIREIRLMLLKNNPIDKRINTITKLSQYNVKKYNEFLEYYLNTFNVINDHTNELDNVNDDLKQIHRGITEIVKTEWELYNRQFTDFKFSIPFLEIKQFKLHIPNNPQLNKASDGNYHSEAFLNIPVNLILTYDENSKEFQYKQNDNPVISVSLSDDSLKSLSGLKNHYDLKDYEKALSHNVNINYPQYDPNSKKNEWLKIKSSNSDLASLVRENYNNKVIVNNNSANLLSVNINWSNENNNVIKDINIDALKNEFYIVNIVKWQDKYSDNRKLITATYDNNYPYVVNRSETFAVVSKEILNQIQSNHRLFYNYVREFQGGTTNQYYIQEHSKRERQKNTEFQNAYFDDGSMTLGKWATMSNTITNNKWNLNQIYDLTDLEFAKSVMFNSGNAPVDDFTKSYVDGKSSLSMNNYNYFDQYSNRKYLESLQFTNTYPGFNESPRNDNYIWSIKQVKALTSESILKVMNQNKRFSDYVSNIITNNTSATNNNANSNLSTDLINKILSDDYLITNMVFSSKNKTSLDETDFTNINYFRLENNFFKRFKLLPFWKSKLDLENNFFKRIDDYITRLLVDAETKIKYRKKLSQIRNIVISKGNVIDNNEFIYQVLLPKDAVLPINIINNIEMAENTTINENINNNNFRFNNWSDVPVYLQNWILSVANFLRTVYLTNLVTISKNNHSITELKWSGGEFKTRNNNTINQYNTDNYGEVVKKLRNQHNSPIKYFKGIWNFMINDAAFPITSKYSDKNYDTYYGLMYDGHNRETQKYIASVLNNGLSRLFDSYSGFNKSYFENNSLNNVLSEIYTTTENSNTPSKYIVSYVNHHKANYSMFYPAIFDASKNRDLAFDNNAFNEHYYKNKDWSRAANNSAIKLKALFQINENWILPISMYRNIEYTFTHLVDVNNISSAINETWINKTIDNLDFRINDNFRGNFNHYHARNSHNSQIDFLKKVMKIFKANNYNVFRINQDTNALVNILNELPYQVERATIKDKDSVYEDIKRFNHHYWYTSNLNNNSLQPKISDKLTLSSNHLTFNGNILKPYFNKAAYKRIENVDDALLSNIDPNAYNIQNELKVPKTIISNYNYFIEQLRNQMRFKEHYDKWLISKNIHPNSFVYNEQTRQNIKNFIKEKLSLINDNNSVSDFIRILRDNVLNKQTTNQITERKEKTVSFNITLIDDTTDDDQNRWNRQFANNRNSSEINKLDAKLNQLRINKNSIIYGYHHYTRSVNVVFDHGGDTSTTEYYDVERPYNIRYTATETKTITVYDKDEYIKQNINLLTLIWYFDTYFIEDFAINSYMNVENNLLNNVDLLLDSFKMKEVIKKYNMDSNYNFSHRHNPYQAFLGKDNKFYFINSYFTYNPSTNKPNTISNFNSIDELAEKIDYEKNIDIYTLNNNNIINEENDLNILIKEINKLASNNDAKINPLRFFSDLDNKLNSYNVIKPYTKNISKNDNQTINSFVENIKTDYFDNLSNPISKYNWTNNKQTYTIANNFDANNFLNQFKNNQNPPVLHLPDGEYVISANTFGKNLEINLTKLKDINLVNGVIVDNNLKDDIEHIKNMIANEANFKDTWKVEYRNNGEIQTIIQSQEYLKDNIIEFDAIINDFLNHYDDNDYIVKIVNDDIDYKVGKESNDKPFKELNYKFNEVVFKSVKNYINNIKARFDNIDTNNNYYRYHILMLYMKKIFAVNQNDSLLSDYQVFSKWNMYFNNVLMNYTKLDDLETKNLTFNWNEKVLDTIKGIINKENIDYNNKVVNNNLIKVYLSHYFNITNSKNNLDNDKFKEYKYNNLKEWIIKNYNENRESEYRNFNINSEVFQYDYETLHTADKYIIEDYGNLIEKKGNSSSFSITINGEPYSFYDHQSDLNKLWNQNNKDNLVKENEIVLLLNDEIKFNNQSMDHISSYVNEIVFNNYNYADLQTGESDEHTTTINKNNINQKLFKRPIYKRKKTLIKIKRDKIVKQNKVLQFIYRSNKYGDILLNITWDENNNYSLWIGDIKVNNASDIALNDIKALENYFAPFIKTDTGNKKVSLNDYSINMNFNKINDNNNLIAYDINANIQLNSDKNKQVYENVLFNIDNENNHYTSNNVKLRYNEYIWREDPQEKIINFENIKTINIDEINEFFRNNFETNNSNTNDYNLAVFVNNVGIYNSINDRLFDIINLVFNTNEINRTKRLSFKDYAAAFNLDELNHNINEYLNLINDNNDIIATLTKRNLKIYQRMLLALDKLLTRQVVNNSVIQDFKDFETLKDLNSKFAISEVIKKVISDLSYTMNNIHLIEERFNQRYSLSAYNEFRQLSNLNQIKEEYKHLKTLTFNSENNNNVLETIKYNFEYTKLKELKKYPNFNLDLFSYHISYSNANTETNALIDFYNQIINENYLKLAFNDAENKYKATRILNSIFYQLYTLITNQTLEHSYNINDEKLKNLEFLNESLKLVKNYEYQYHTNASRSGYGSFLITPKSTYEMYEPYMANNSINGNSRVLGSSEYDFILKNNTGNRIYNTINKKTSDKYYSNNETATPYDNHQSNNLITNNIDVANNSLRSNFNYNTDSQINDLVKIESIDELKGVLEQLIEIPDTTFKFYLFNDIENRKTLFATMSLIIQYHKNKYQRGETLSPEMIDTINKLSSDIKNMINKYNKLNNINKDVLKQTDGLSTYLDGNHFTKNQKVEFSYQNTNYEVISISPYNEYASKTLMTFNYLLNNFKEQMKPLNANYAQLFNIYTIFNIFIEKLVNEMNIFSENGLYLLADKDQVAASQIDKLQQMRREATQKNNLLSYILSNNLAYNENPFGSVAKGTRTIFSILSPVYYGISIYDTIKQSKQINAMIANLKQTLNDNISLIENLGSGVVKDYLSNEIFNISNLEKQINELDASNNTANYLLGYALNVALNNPIVLIFVGDIASRNVLHNLVRYDMAIMNNEIKYTYDYYNLKNSLSYDKVKVVIKNKDSNTYKEIFVNVGNQIIPSNVVYDNILFNLPYVNNARLWSQSSWLNENDKNNYIKQINIYERFNLRNGYELNGENLLPIPDNNNNNIIKIDTNSGLRLYKFK